MNGRVVVSEWPGNLILEGRLTAFNFPVAIYGWSFALSFAAGNVTTWKPLETTPLCTIAVTKIIAQVSFSKITILQDYNKVKWYKYGTFVGPRSYSHTMLVRSNGFVDVPMSSGNVKFTTTSCPSISWSLSASPQISIMSLENSFALNSSHWGQRGYYPGSKFWVFWEFFINLLTQYLLGKFRVFSKIAHHFDQNLLTGQFLKLIKKSSSPCPVGNSFKKP